MSERIRSSRFHTTLRLFSALALSLAVAACDTDDDPETGLPDDDAASADVVGGDAAGGDAVGGDTSLDDTSSDDVSTDLGDDDMAEPEDAVEPDVTESDVSGPDVSEPDTTEPDTSEPDAGPTQICPPGLVGCAGGERLICNDDGTAFETEACPEQTLCFDGECVECVTNEDCGEAMTCQANVCTTAPLTFVTEVIPDALLGVPYLTTVDADGGVPPYVFDEVNAENWPIGVALGDDGQLGGVPQESGSWTLELSVTDAAGTSIDATLDFHVSELSLAITTPSPLPTAVEGEPYSVQLTADGGTEPYFFGALDPLPQGLMLSPNGLISGVPVVDEAAPFLIKVFDNGAPTLSASRLFELPIQLAPLEIIADQELDLFVTKLITLPVIVVSEAFPVPYNAQLTAKGGKKPYTWKEIDLPGFVQNLIPNSGLPEGLTLNADGTVTGAVTNPELVVSVQIPFTDIVITGFFFGAEVSDSQDETETKSALFLIPTVPI